MSEKISGSPSTINLRAIVDDAGLSPYRVRILLLVALAMFVDGYDMAAMSFAAPTLAREWGLDPEAVGSVFSISAVGMMIGGGAAAMLGDLVGRRWLVILATLLCTVTTFGTSLATDLQSLTIWRLLAGLGLGALGPACLVITNEYAPSRIRATVLTLVFLGYTAGGQGIAGWIAALLVPTLGWTTLFHFGAIASLLTTVVLVLWMPESLKHLYVKHPDSRQIPLIAAKLSPDVGIAPESRFVWPSEERSTGRVPLRMLVSDGRWRITPVVWLSYFLLQMVVPALSVWRPSLLEAANVSASTVANISIVYSVMGLVGALITGRLMDKYGIICHAGLVFLSVPMVLLVALFAGDPTLLAVVISISGFATTGGLVGMGVLVGFLYPTAIRSTGVGLAVFVARIGMVVGPALLGMLLTSGGDIRTVFQACAIPLLVAAVGVFIIGLLDRPRFLREKAAQHATRL